MRPHAASPSIPSHLDRPNRADARIRTGDPFITRALRRAEVEAIWLG